MGKKKKKIISGDLYFYNYRAGTQSLRPPPLPPPPVFPFQPLSFLVLRLLLQSPSSDFLRHKISKKENELKKKKTRRKEKKMIDRLGKGSYILIYSVFLCSRRFFSTYFSNFFLYFFVLRFLNRIVGCIP